MGYRVVRFEATPNPDAVKVVVEPSPGAEPRSYFNAGQAEAEGDGLAVALFGVSGVTNVLIHVEFVTVCKASGTPWGGVKAGVERVLAEADGGAGA